MDVEIKTMKGWETFADSPDKGDFNLYVKPGDLVDESIFDYFLNVLPPHRWREDYLQAGEPYGTAFNPEADEWLNTYTTFERVAKGLYEYRGKCFTDGYWDQGAYHPETIKEFLERTYRVRNCIQTPRPSIRCKDGFEISVQAGEAYYSTPRDNLKNGEFEAVECGALSEKEDLIINWAEESEEPTNTVYPFVSIGIIEQVIEKHGGILKYGRRI